MSTDLIACDLCGQTPNEFVPYAGVIVCVPCSHTDRGRAVLGAIDDGTFVESSPLRAVRGPQTWVSDPVFDEVQVRRSWSDRVTGALAWLIVASFVAVVVLAVVLVVLVLAVLVAWTWRVRPS